MNEVKLEVFRSNQDSLTAKGVHKSGKKPDKVRPGCAVVLMEESDHRDDTMVPIGWIHSVLEVERYQSDYWAYLCEIALVENITIPCGTVLTVLRKSADQLAHELSQNTGEPISS